MATVSAEWVNAFAAAPYSDLVTLTYDDRGQGDAALVRDVAKTFPNVVSLRVKDALDALPAGDPSISSAELRRCLQGGTAFHVSDLDRDERRVIEDAFRAPDSTIRVMVFTLNKGQE